MFQIDKLLLDEMIVVVVVVVKFPFFLRFQVEISKTFTSLFFPSPRMGCQLVRQLLEEFHLTII